jgi:flagellar protein FliS
MNSAIALYQNVDLTARVESASPEILIQLLFDGAKARLQRAEQCIVADNIDGRTREINSAIAIFDGLQGSLDHDRGGELAANLDSLYDYMQRRLYQANAGADAGAVREVLDLLESIASAWSVMAPVENGAA